MLCSKYNLSLLIHVVNYNSMLDVDKKNNRIIGIIGELLQKLIDVKSPKRFNCKLFPVRKDFKCVNNSCSLIDPINLLAEDDKFDLFFRREHPIVENDKILLSNVVGFEYTMLAHALDTYDNKINEKLFNQFIIYNFLIILLLFSINFLLMIYLIRLSKNKSTFLKILFNFDKIINLGQNKRKIFIIFITIFLVRFFKEIYSNSVQFNQVIVDTTKLIKTSDDILTTNRKICWIQDEKDIYFFQNSNYKFMNKIWTTKNYDPICRFSPSIFDPSSGRFPNSFTFAKQFVANLLASSIPHFFKLTIWVNPKPFFEYVTVYYLRRSLEKEKIIFINKICYDFFEFGLIDVTKILGSKIFQYEKGKVFFDLKQFVDQNTKFEELNLKRLESIFYFYLILNLIIIIIFIINMINRRV